MNKYTSLLSIIALILILPSISCGNRKSKQKITSDSVRLVDTATVREQISIESESYAATIEASVRNHIAPQTPMRIAQLLVRVGDRVEKGQILARMDQTNLAQAKIQLANRKNDFERMQSLFQIGGIAQVQYEQAQTAYQIAQEQYKNLTDNAILRSPSAGIITVRNYDNGDMYNGQVPIYTVEEISPVKVKINASEQLFGRVKAQMPVAITIDALSGKEYTGSISIIYPTIDARSHTFPIEIEIPNKDQAIRPGMYARARLDLGSRSILTVPDRAVIKQMGSDERFVFVLDQSIARQKMIRIGKQDSTFYEVRNGLNKGDIVITAGATNLVDGDSVQIKK